MHGKYIFIAFTVMFLCFAPAAASLQKITSLAPVYVGERDLDISAALNGCHSIAFWPNGTGAGSPPLKNLTLYERNTVTDKIYHFTLSPDIFSGYEGMWYCEDKLPPTPVFEVRAPRIALSVWDVDSNRDISGTSVPVSANVTYRIDTNMDQALTSRNRPEINPSDSFFTVTLANPRGQGITSIFTGSAGAKTTQILSFDANPFVDASPYFWRNGHAWDLRAKNAVGEIIYPPGTYTFTLTQNLNHMQETYEESAITDLAGTTTATASVTFIVAPPASLPGGTSPVVSTQPQATVTVSRPGTTDITAIPTSPPLPVKTTYSPLPPWSVLAGIGIAAIVVLLRRSP